MHGQTMLPHFEFESLILLTSSMKSFSKSELTTWQLKRFLMTKANPRAPRKAAMPLQSHDEAEVISEYVEDPSFLVSFTYFSGLFTFLRTFQNY